MRWAQQPGLMEPPDGETVGLLALAQAARWLGVAPWELAERPAIWMDIGLLGLAMERQANGSGGSRRKSRPVAEGAAR